MADNILLTPEPDTIFEEPWQAEVFATTVSLSRQGAFTWPEWVETFAAHIKEEPQRQEEDVPTAYYRQWLAALESVTSDRLQLSPASVDQRQGEWERAYLNTPHGQPVELTNAAHHHHEAHDHHQGEAAHGKRQTPRPVAVSAPHKAASLDEC